MTDVIRIDNLTKCYGKARGITNLSLQVQEGEMFGFIGPNGAGKSTTIRTLLGMIGKTSGSAQIFGMDIEKEHIAILKRVGYMPSEAMFYPDMTVQGVTRLCADIRRLNCKTEADALCERLQLDTKKKIGELSLGNRKKVAVVCAMQHRPDLYIMDEPTSGLDPLMQKVFFDLLQERRDQGATVFLSSHVLSEVQRHCSRAAIIREGKLIACDTVMALSRTSARRVLLTGTEHAPQIPGVKDEKPMADGVSFLFSGNINALTAAISGMTLTDVSITEPDLDEIFMHFYQQEVTR